MVDMYNKKSHAFPSCMATAYYRHYTSYYWVDAPLRCQLCFGHTIVELYNVFESSNRICICEVLFYVEAARFDDAILIYDCRTEYMSSINAKPRQ